MRTSPIRNAMRHAVRVQRLCHLIGNADYKAVANEYTPREIPDGVKEKIRKNAAGKLIF